MAHVEESTCNAKHEALYAAIVEIRNGQRAINKMLAGNGDIGLCETVRLNARRIDAVEGAQADARPVVAPLVWLCRGKRWRVVAAFLGLLTLGAGSGAGASEAIKAFVEYLTK